jgi:regulator of sigma E protease
VGIAVVAGDVAEQGLTPFLQFIAMLSVNLAVINFLPIPALDGGRAIFLIVEGIRRKPISRSVEIGIHNIAFLLLLVLMALITARDIGRL